VARLFGVVEGFYRRPYTHEQRLELIDFLSRLGLNAYVYGPKTDNFHRKNWRKTYSAKHLEQFVHLSRRSRKKNIKFIYALSPVNKPELCAVEEKIATMLELGIDGFSLFFDDIKTILSKKTAEKQLIIANGLMEYLLRRLDNPYLSFCPTQYHGFKKTPYIEYIAAHLHRYIDIFWTGRNVVSKRISAQDVARIAEILGRPVLIWDNIFANDYIPGRIHKFPYRNREPGIVQHTRGVLINPMNQYAQSKPLIYSAAQFFRDPYKYSPEAAWSGATKI
jgi:hyaluronoglucosaminidase